jgi:uncharacterized phage-associated protein
MIIHNPIEKIADLTLLYLFEQGVSVRPLKLQKLLYYLQAWHMVYFGRENLIFDDTPEAWVNGPVYREIWKKYRHVGMYDQIPTSEINGSLEQQRNSLNLSPEQLRFLEFMYDYYGLMNHDKLVLLTHSEKPWSEIREHLPQFEYSEEKISLDTMYEYYKERKDRNRAKKK